MPLEAHQAVFAANAVAEGADAAERAAKKNQKPVLLEAKKKQGTTGERVVDGVLKAGQQLGAGIRRKASAITPSLIHLREFYKTTETKPIIRFSSVEPGKAVNPSMPRMRGIEGGISGQFSDRRHPQNARYRLPQDTSRIALQSFPEECDQDSPSGAFCRAE